MCSITELDLITARAAFTGDISGEKITLVLCHYGKQTVSIQGSGLLPRRCNQATGQLRGLWGVYFPNDKGLHIYFFLALDFSFTLSLVWEESLKAFFLIEKPRLYDVR